MAWYYALNGVRKGPVSEPDFEELVLTGTLPPETLVWRPGMPDWIPLQLALEESASPAALPPTEGAAPARITTTHNRLAASPKRITTAQTNVAATGSGPARITTSQTLARIGTARIHANSPAVNYEIPHPFEFKGSAGEYFRIWIVNTVLTIATLGIFAAWAKVRTRQYFARNTFVDGYSFDFTGNPTAILKGNFIIGLGIALVSGISNIVPEAGVAMFIVFGLIFPWLVEKAHYFRARKTEYRNLSFGFHATRMESYIVYFGLPILIPLTLGLIIPYWWSHKQKYFWGNLSYGNTRFFHHGETKWFYLFLLKVIGIMLAMGIVCFGLMFLVSTFGLLAAANLPHTPTMGGPELVIGLGIFSLSFLFTLFLPAYIWSRVNTYAMNSTAIGGKIRFSAHFRARDLLWLQVSNTIAIIFTCGLATPWAKIRMARYKCSCISLIVQGALGDVAVGAKPPTTALGDAAADIFDFEIGL